MTEFPLSGFEPGSPADLASLPTLTSAQSTLAAEIAGLSALQGALAPSEALGAAFAEAVACIACGRGHVVVSGIGKSGHIGRKIQATLASTGTPAFFVHPAEAAHGDLGMIDTNDVILLISQSGETSELAALLEHAARHALPVIGMTASTGSTLAKASTIVLPLPRAPEACPMGLAPTTSTIMQLALGDALAIALLERRGFTANDFGAFHPGGKLGALLRPVAKLMHTGDSLPLGTPDMTLSSVIIEMTRKAFGCIGILDEGGILIGLISDGDLRPALDRDLTTTCAREIMNHAPITTRGDMLAQEVIHLMTARRKAINSLFVLDDEGRPAGIIHLHDLLRTGIA
ncbi:KpsF/GutQ family sugar-phosphate isomerase [Swaminathania salitolerans]|uniref:Arabinose-5-phosphate isomerase n=1 Tax=Swaminathania salitolerans TaxID=182838 RepID=A0A511BM99_9PROT|nr:KpsF/GutQ family sugar-phosphate isomerase [Swaminathania salitolerans]GBQ15705.1 arabinose-5-phosphate isomerase GutQ [Swaminathania salitolerans LMG 21291]GEL01456.1 arabinose-5-phosphate isomerase [Swaminathania salitolerans]